jgi:hypothetical protein
MRPSLYQSENKPLPAVLPGPGAPISFEYLDRALNLAAPYLTRKEFRLHLNVTTPAGHGGLARILPQIIARMTIWDHQGVIFDLSGAEWRVWTKATYGMRYTDGLDIAANTTTDVIIYLPVPIEFPSWAKQSLTRWPLRPFRAGGRMQVQFNGATLGSAGGGTDFLVNSGDYEWHDNISDEFVVTGKQRIEVKSDPIDQIRKVYAVGHGTGGQLVFALMYNGPTSENAGTPWLGFGTVTPPLVSSQTLDYFNWDQQDLQQTYLRHRFLQLADNAGTVITEDPVMAGNVIPFVNPEEDQNFLELPEVQSFEWEVNNIPLGSIPTDATMIVAACVDRSRGQQAHTFKSNSGNALSAPNAVKTSDGKVKLYKDLPATSQFARLKDRLPAAFVPTAAPSAPRPSGTPNPTAANPNAGSGK